MKLSKLEWTLIGLAVLAVMSSSTLPGSAQQPPAGGGGGGTPPSMDAIQAIQRGKQALDNVAGASLPESVKEIALAIAWAESRLGMAVQGAGTFAGSNNWGAMVGTGNAGHIVHGDHDASGKPITTNFQAHTTPEDGARAFLSIWAVGDTLAAALRGDIDGVARGMYARHYYTGTPTPGTEQGSPADVNGRVRAYANMIRGSLGTVKKALGVT